MQVVKVYGNVFSDEFHSRLRFNHRGIVACADAGPPHSNGSQFFITLDRCEWLDLYSLTRLSEVETEIDRPLDPPPKITSVEVLWNPFDDIVPRAVPAKALPSSTVDVDNKASKKIAVNTTGKKMINLQKAELASVKTKIKSSHDVLNDPRLLKGEGLSKELIDCIYTFDGEISFTFGDAREKKLDSPTEEVGEKKNAPGESKSAKKKDKSSKEAKEQQDHPNGTDPTNESDEAAVTEKAEVDTPVVDGKEKINKVA
ncbi:hypothetical protein RHGRI_030211 [Rhododendron griersonianum]|uniref:PPIase cyclophilin-type domain-containing protein n=1 Tax=Rhododendron griersonianum TaxID=479676 RepID=A0AAV6IP87_9ERIC|nr:hypothetical protein RHGRI_030211 [Rhododendron griersonianum]